MGLASETFLFIDCQTSGLSPSQSEILEIGWSFSIDPKAIHTALLCPADAAAVPEKVWKILGLSPEAFADALSAAEVWRAVVTEAKALGVTAVVIHYAAFEQGFLRALHLAVFGEKELPWPVICTYRVAGRICEELPARTLRALSGYLGQVLPPTQRSLDHVAATQRVWQFLLERLQERESITTWEAFQPWFGVKPIGRVKKEKPKRTYLISPEVRRRLPLGPGVYEMRSGDGTLLYIGKATSLRARVASYFQKRKGDRQRLPELMTQVHDLQVIETATPLEAALLETDRIKHFEPHYNTALRKNERRVLFFNWDLETHSESRTPEHPLGPFLHEEPFESVGILMRILNDAATALDESILVHPVAEVRPRLEEVLAELGIGSAESVTASELLRLGKKLPPPLEPTEEIADEADAPDTDAIELTPAELEAEIRASILRKLRRPGRALHRARWLVRMGNCRAAWRLGAGDSDPWRYLVMQGGQVRDRGTVEHLEALPEYRRGKGSVVPAVSVEDYDRLRVLVTELTLLARRVPVRIEFSRTRCLARDAGTWLSRVAWNEERAQ